MRKFVTKVRERNGVVRAEVLDREDVKRGPLAGVVYVRSESGLMAAQLLAPIVPRLSTEEDCSESGVVKAAAQLPESPPNKRGGG